MNTDKRSQGVDIISIGRVEKALDRSGDNFLRRIFDGRELEKRDDSAFLATRFAAKEAFFKALGTGVSDGIRWHDFILPPEDDFRMSPIISGRSRKLLGNRRALTSVSCTETTAVAVVILD